MTTRAASPTNHAAHPAAANDQKGDTVVAKGSTFSGIAQGMAERDRKEGKNTTFQGAMHTLADLNGFDLSKVDGHSPNGRGVDGVRDPDFVRAGERLFTGGAAVEVAPPRGSGSATGGSSTDGGAPSGAVTGGGAAPTGGAGGSTTTSGGATTTGAVSTTGTPRVYGPFAPGHEPVGFSMAPESIPLAYSPSNFGLGPSFTSKTDYPTPDTKVITKTFSDGKVYEYHYTKSPQDLLAPPALGTQYTLRSATQMQ